MSEAVNRLDNDPPVLRALLVAAGDDREVSAQITRAYYGVMEGAHSSPSVMHAILLSAIYNAFLRSIASSNGNGVSPGQLKSSQLEAITVSLKALPVRDDVASKKDLQRIEQAIQKIEKIQDRQSPGQIQTEYWASRWAKLAGVGFILFGLGYLLCWAQLHREGDARVDRIINSQKTEYHVPLWLISHQGSISLGPLKPSEGHNETQGIIIYPGDLKLAQPWVSTDGATVVPIK
jgi:hypothetical protein